MRLFTTDPLFAWDKLPDSVDLMALRYLLDLIPDEALLAALRKHRGRGRDDYKIPVLWRTHLARYFLRHGSMEGCLAELGRNPALRQVVGLGVAEAIPDSHNMSRFLHVLGQPEHLGLVQEMFKRMVRRLGQAVPDLGRDVAGDSAALCARVGRAKKKGNATGDGGHDGQRELDLPEQELAKQQREEEEESDPRLPQPGGGRKEYKDDQGKLTKVYEWFGYKFHLLVDIKHEVVLACRITSAAGEGTGDSSVLPHLLEDAQAVLPAGRMQTLAFDKAADDQKTHAMLKERGIKPVIQNRDLWNDQERERMLPGHDGNSNVVYDEAGTLFCYDKVSDPPVKQKMSYVGYEKSRGTLKYRCPARAGELVCPSDGTCNGCSRYGKTVRVKCEIDLRRFPPIPRATKEFARRYNGRTAVERINGRTKVYWGADDGNVTGAQRFHAHLMTVMLVQQAMACWLAVQPRYEGKSLSPTRMSQIAMKLAKANRRVA